MRPFKLVLTHGHSTFNHCFYNIKFRAAYCGNPQCNKTASVQNREKNLFQKTSLFQRWFSNLTMKMLAKATAIFVPMAVPWVRRQLLPHNCKEFSVNIKKIRYSISLKIFVHVAYGGYALFVWCAGVETSNVHRNQDCIFWAFFTLNNIQEVCRILQSFFLRY